MSMKWKILLLYAFFAANFNFIQADCSDDTCETTDCNDSCDDACTNDPQFGKTFFHAREANQNTPLRMMGNASYMHIFGKECEIYGVFSAAIGYERSSNHCNLGKVFSFDSSGTTLFAGDRTTTNTSSNVDVGVADSNARATDFGMSGTHAETLKFSPTISKVIIDFDLFVGLDECISGLWARVSAPIIHARYDLDPCSSVTFTGGSYYAAGFVDTGSNTVAVPYTDVKTAWNKLGTFGDVESSSCGKLPCSSKRKTTLGAVSLDLGYDFVRCEDYALGISLHGVIPTGNAPRATVLFAPIAGTYNWQLGGSFNAHWTAWCCDDEQRFTLYAYGVMTHMFKDRHIRLLGLTLGNETPGNSWILLKKFDGAGVYDGSIVRASSLLGRNIKVGNNFMSDISIMAEYKCRCFNISLGYNFWYRSKDKYSIKCQDKNSDGCRNGCYGAFTADTYGIKGISAVGTTANAQFYSKEDSNIHTSGTLISNAATADSSTFVLESDVNPCVALAPSAYSNKIFVFIGYTGQGIDYEPYFGIGGMYEWAQQNRAANQYGIYVKVGVSF